MAGIPLRSVREVIRERLAPLPPACRDALEVASVLGRDFEYVPLAAALRTSPASAVTAHARVFAALRDTGSGQASDLAHHAVQGRPGVSDEVAAVNAEPKRFDHICYRTDDGFTVIDVWEDEASFNAFGSIIGPALAGAGLDPKPIIYPLEGTMGRDGKHFVY